MSARKFPILLVDDIPANLEALEGMLQSETRTFLKAGSGTEALQLVMKNKDIGLILLDVQMPDMDGFEVAHYVKSYKPSSLVPIIFVTAISKEEKFIMKGYDRGAVDYLFKPLNVDITRSKVEVFEKLYLFQRVLLDSLAENEQVNSKLQRFTNIVAHELKSPLTGMISLVELLLEDERLLVLDGIPEYLNLLSNAAMRSSEMIDHLLQDSKVANAKVVVEMVDTNDLVSEMIKLLFTTRPAETIIHETLPVFQTNRLKLQHVFHNLISNAIKYNDKQTIKIEVGSIEKERFYEFFVKDNGRGIKEEDCKRIFELFETAGPSTESETATGVGLNIAKMYVEEQDGKIWVDSSPGIGSSFYFQWKKADSNSNN
ncbi:His Kinase A (phospho-acceptor) domain-containing protein [Pedobacter terrae]|uniref:histidine kinase n=1 Tax=Pedobacter terrae TaxID=405671 RepID=A0A1G7NRZ8_9SPHI|nr:hybrid sensor histidine kinase/response regulator [Pedobacter terrae]SDF76743.1 His Kinase A (phospho-acceptor) domain-containing protein [Pedobacter terrae]